MSAVTIGFGGAKPGDAAGHGQKAIERLFSPEFRNRLDAVVTFKPLNRDIMEMIVGKYVAELNAQLKDKKVTVDVSEQAVAWLAAKGYDPSYGARPLSRLIQEKIKDPLADELLFGQLQKGGFVTVDVAKEGPKKGQAQPAPQEVLTFEFKARAGSREPQKA